MGNVKSKNATSGMFDQVVRICGLDGCPNGTFVRLSPYQINQLTELSSDFKAFSSKYLNTIYPSNGAPACVLSGDIIATLTADGGIKWVMVQVCRPGSADNDDGYGHAKGEWVVKGDVLALSANVDYTIENVQLSSEAFQRIHPDYPDAYMTLSTYYAGRNALSQDTPHQYSSFVSERDSAGCAVIGKYLNGVDDALLAIHALEILRALRAGNYEVSYIAPKNISEHKTPSGRTFYIIDVWGNSDCGCEIDVAGFTYTCWVREDSNGWEVEKDGQTIQYAGDLLSEEICDALDDIDEGGVHDEPFQDVFVRFYELANGCTCDELYVPEGGDEPPIDVDDVPTPSDCGEDEVDYDGKKYWIVDELEEDDGDETIQVAYAIAEDAECDDEGKYPCVRIEFEDNDGERGEVISVEDSDSTYDAMNEEFEE